MHCALVDTNGTVVNVAVFDEAPATFNGCTVVALKASDRVNPGDTYADGAFVKTPALEPAPRPPSLEERIAALEVDVLLLKEPLR